MTRAYLDRIWTATTSDGKTVSVYAQYSEGRVIHFLVNKHRQRVGQYQNKDAALTEAARLVGRPAAPRPTQTKRELWAEAAEVVRSGGKYAPGKLEFGVLATLTAMDAEAGKVHKINAQAPFVLADILFEAGLGTVGDDNWCRAVCALLTEKFETKATLKGKLQTFTKCLRNLDQYSCFVPFRAHAHYYHAIVVSAAAVGLRHKLSTVHHEPLTVPQILSLYEAAPSQAAVLHLTLLLSMGFRKGEDLRVKSQHIVDHRLKLKDVQTKVETGRTPPLSVAAELAIRAHLPLSDSDLYWFGHRKSAGRERGTRLRELRTTCATHLVHAGYKPILTAERLGHTDMHMVIRHYAKPGTASPLYPDWEIPIPGYSPENDYDAFILGCLLLSAAKGGWLEHLRPHYPAPAVTQPKPRVRLAV